jgi:hypothetical protein
MDGALLAIIDMADTSPNKDKANSEESMVSYLATPPRRYANGLLYIY